MIGPRNLLRHPKMGWFTLAAALVLSLPSFRLGFYADDYIMLASLERRIPSHASWFDLYDFADGDRRGNLDLIARGGLPWWSHPELKLHFLRPLSSALTAFDHLCFGHAPLGYHLHLVLWYLALVAGVRLLFKRILRPEAAELAALLFAVDHTHTLLFAWIANRHMVVSAVPAVLGLSTIVDWREHGRRMGRVLGPFAIAIGLCGGEAALGAVAYWLAYEFVRAVRKDQSNARWRSLAAPIVLALVYCAVYRYLGFGAAHTDGYLDPFASPSGYAKALAARAPLLFADYLWAMPSEITGMAMPAPFIGAGIAAFAFALWLSRSRWPALSESERNALRWLVAGALGSVLVVVGGFAGGRLLLFPSIGAAGWLSTLLLAPAGENVSRGRVWLDRAASRSMGAIHLVLAPILQVALIVVVSAMARRTERLAIEAEIRPPYPKRVILLAAADPMLALYFAELRSMLVPGTVSRVHLVSMAPYAHELTRAGSSKLVLKAHGPMLRESFETLLRPRAASLAVGSGATWDIGRVAVSHVEDGSPDEVTIDLDEPWEEEDLVLLAWQDGALRRVPVPKSNESVALPWDERAASFP